VIVTFPAVPRSSSTSIFDIYPSHDTAYASQTPWFVLLFDNHLRNHFHSHSLCHRFPVAPVARFRSHRYRIQGNTLEPGVTQTLSLIHVTYSARASLFSFSLFAGIAKTISLTTLSPLPLNDRLTSEERPLSAIARPLATKQHFTFRASALQQHSSGAQCHSFQCGVTLLPLLLVLPLFLTFAYVITDHLSTVSYLSPSPATHFFPLLRSSSRFTRPPPSSRTSPCLCAVPLLSIHLRSTRSVLSCLLSLNNCHYLIHTHTHTDRLSSSVVHLLCRTRMRKSHFLTHSLYYFNVFRVSFTRFWSVSLHLRSQSV
jgi:hypothetical protein